MIKKILAFFAIVSFILPVGTFAQTSPTSVSSSNISAEIYVKNIILDKDSYNAGDIVTGSFVLNNSSSFAVPDASYKISLVGDYQPNTLAKAFYDTKTFESVFLKAKEDKTISFKYVLPIGISGDNLGIQIRAVLGGGQPMGWSDAFISVKGNSLPMASIKRSLINVENKLYGLQAGPMIQKNQKVYLDVVLGNQSTSTINVTPEIIIFDRSENREILSDTKSSEISLLPNKETKGSFQLPVFNYTPKIYAGKIIFKDFNGIERAPSINFRYIVAGPIATIQGITSDKEWGYKGDVVTLAINLTGSPYDISSIEIPKIGNVDLLVILSNEKKQEVGRIAKTINADNISGSIIIPIKLENSVSFININATVSQNNNVLDSYSSSLSFDFHQFPFLSQTAYMIIGIVVGFILFIVCFIFFRKKKDILPILIIGFGLVLSGISSQAFAQFVLDGSMTSFWGTNQAGSPVLGTASDVRNPSIVLNPIVVKNGKYYITGTITAQVCYNQPANLLVTIQYPDPSSTPPRVSTLSTSTVITDPAGVNYAEIGSVNRSFNADNTGSGQVSFGPFIAVMSSQSNTQQTVNVSADNRRYWYQGQLIAFGSTWGHINYTSPISQSGSCNSLTNGISTSVAPTTNLCSVGIPSVVTDNGNSFNWTCTSDTPVNCFATKLAAVCTPTYTCNAGKTGYINSCTGVTTACSSGLICSQGGCTHSTNLDNTSVGTVTLQSFITSPNTINSNGTCNFTWTLSQYDSASFCNVFDSQNNPVLQSASPITKTGTVSKANVTRETTYRVECGEKVINADGSITITKIPTKYATCNINPSFNEANY